MTSLTPNDRRLRLARTEAAYTRSERRYLGGGSAEHQRSVTAYNRTVRRYSRALCAFALADYEAEVKEARKDAEQASLLARENEIEAATGTLRLWHVSRGFGGRDTYSDFVVVAATAAQAARIHPCHYNRWDKAQRCFVTTHDGSPTIGGSWTDDVDSLKVERIGDAANGMVHGWVVCKSFHG